ncbi:Integrase [Pectobacterium carotovorum subsp. carotovorum PCCS1]|nr:Integrase [Pectobacterium carotovorum subsp. carotovorum PCCS1]
MAARKLAGMISSDNPPIFHEIRGLSGRHHNDVYSEEFAKKLLDHISEATIKMYLDERGETKHMLL